MTYRLVLSEGARRQIKKLNKHVGLMLANEMKKRLDGLSNPRQHGKALVGNKKGLWRYRIGTYRIIWDIQDDKLIILALEVGYRKNIYE